MTTLLLIRHGESEANREGLFAGHINPDLLPKGIEQAELTAKYVEENYKVDKIYSSDLQRAYKTGECLAKRLNLKIEADTALREIYGGEWEGIKFKDLSTLYPKEYEVWMNDLANAICVKGESIKELGERVMKKITEIAKINDGKTVAITTHATPIRLAQSIIETGGLERLKEIPWVANASVTELKYEKGLWSVVKANLSEHLKDLVTSLPNDV